MVKADLLTRWKEPIRSGGKVLSLQLLSFTTGFFMARSQILNQYTPLGVAFTAGVTGEYTLTAAIGALLGYLIPTGGVNNIRYMGAVGICALMAWLLGNFFAPPKKPLFSAMAGGVGLLTVLLILNVAGEASATVAEIIGECLLTAGSAYFFCCSSQILQKGNTLLTPHETASCVIAITLILTVFTQFTLFDFSPARTAGILLILYGARYGRETIGAVTAVATGFSVYLADPSLSAVSLGFMIGGLIAGVFSPLGKIGCAAAFVLTNGLIAIQTYSHNTLPVLYEVLTATVVFMVLPGKVNRFFNKLFSPPPEAPLVEGLRNSIVMRLAFAADALRDVSQTVEEVSAKLKKINAPSFEHIFQKTEDNACARCSMRIYCWESNKGETLSALLFATKKIRKTGTVQPEDLPTPFTEHCLHLERVLDTLTVHLNDFLAKDAAGRRLEEIRGVIAEQFQGIAQMLGGLSEEFHTASRYDYDTAAQIRSGLLSMEINPLDISCQIDQYGRLTAEIRLLREDNKKINRSILLRELGEKCGRDFESPTLSDAGKSMLLTLSEKAEYTVDFGVAQYSYRNNKLCGDAYQGFFDGRGRFVMIVSDGMGKGGRAAVDGTMASGLMARLIKAGFDPDSALKIVNSAMLYKSTDESLATIDVTVLDLFSGITEFFKAGAPPTIIRKNGKSGIAAGENLPAGIVSQVAFDHTQTSLTKGDIIVMMSDGALGDGTDWIGVELEVWNAPGATALAEHLADYAKRRCTEQQSDDITVAVAIIEKSY